jgi:hypothetical protein
MKTAFVLFFVLMLLSLNAKAQQTFNSLKIKDLELPNESVSKVLYLNGDKKVKTSNVDFAELEHLEGVTSGIQDQLNLKAPLASPALTGTPTAPTAAAMTNTTQIATTEFVTSALSGVTDPSKVSGPASSVNSEIVLFDSTTGKLIKRATGSGYVKATSGVYSTSSTVATSDLTGTVPLATGGTNKNMTAINGGIVYTDADSHEVSAAGTSGQYLKSNGAAAPTWVSLSGGIYAAPGSEIYVTGGSGHGSTNTKIRRFTTTVKSVGTDITNSGDSATLGHSFTINTAGVYAITYCDAHSGQGNNHGVSVNSNQLTSTIATITEIHRINFTLIYVANYPSCVSSTVNLNAGDVVRAHTEGNHTNTGATNVNLRITKVTP